MPPLYAPPASAAKRFRLAAFAGLFLGALAVCPAAGAQGASPVVTGRVVSAADGVPLAGATVRVQGTTLGAATDGEGRFELEVPSLQDTLVVSFVGFGTQTVPLAGRSRVDVVLTEDAALAEVVVVGYGTQEREDVTGAISSVPTRVIEEVARIRPEQVLQGTIPGVLVRENGGGLDGQFSVAVRGITSTRGNEPLYVVDGIPLAGNNLATIDPQNIASIDVLKDASATAIYGARAANGVVIVTTKTGQAGPARIVVESEAGVQEPRGQLDLMNSRELADLWIVGRPIRNQPIPTEFSDPSFFEEDNDYQDLITQSAPWLRQRLTVSGGTGPTQFLASGSYTDREGILINTERQIITGRVNVDHRADRFTLGARFEGSREWGNGAQNDITFGSNYRNALYSKPWVPAFDDEGNLASAPYTGGAYDGFTPAPIAAQTFEVREYASTRLLGNAFLDIRLPYSLSARTSLGVDLNEGNSRFFVPTYDVGTVFTRQNVVGRGFRDATNWVVDQTLTFDRRLAAAHDVTALAGFSLQDFAFDNLDVDARGLTDPDLDQVIGQPDLIGAGGAPSGYQLMSFFGRVNYGYLDRYLVTATLRRDGSSRFGPENRWGYFPSASVGWRVSEEPFFDVPAVNNLKLRLSYGLTGAEDIPNYVYLARAGAFTTAFGDAVYSAVLPTSLANEDVKWETNTQADLGFELEMFRGRLSVVADVYNRRSSDLLYNPPIPLASGIGDAPFLNIGSIRNRGVELGVRAVLLDTRAVRWTTDFNVSTNQNEALDLGSNSEGEPLVIFGGFLDGANRASTITQAGDPVSLFYGFVADGIWREGEEPFGLGAQTGVGDVKFRDLNGDGRITPEGDRTVIGSPHPDAFGGLTNTVRVGPAELSAFLTYSVGNDVINTFRVFGESGFPGFNALADYDYYSAENTDAEDPRPNSPVAFTNNGQPSTRLVEDGSYVKLKNLSFSYDLPARLVGSVGAQALRLTLTGTNLLTFTRYTGSDPENNSRGLTALGLDFTPYPFARSVLLQARLTL